jgi:sulfur-oxidizing protein SoxY
LCLKDADAISCRNKALRRLALGKNLLRHSHRRRGLEVIMIARRTCLALLALPFAAAARADDALSTAIRETIGDKPVTDGGILLRVPGLAENGGQVPLGIVVESPMTAQDHITAIHVFASRNPTPGVATFRLTPLLARAEVQTRIRLAEDQRLIVLAETSTGRVMRASAEMRVGAGGCLT